MQTWLEDARVRERGWTLQNLNGRLEMIEGRLEPDQLLKLHFQNNIYVSSGHGEAWCLPAFDAKCAGNRLIHIPWGGSADFDSPSDVRVPYRLEPAHPSYNWGEDARWAEYNVDDLAEALVRAKPPTSYVRSADFEDRFSLASVGLLMRQLVMEVARSAPRARRYFEERLTP